MSFVLALLTQPIIGYFKNFMLNLLCHTSVDIMIKCLSKEKCQIRNPLNKIWKKYNKNKVADKIIENVK